MKRMWVGVLLVSVLIAPVWAAGKKDKAKSEESASAPAVSEPTRALTMPEVAAHLQAVSVTLRSGTGHQQQGSGVICVKEVDGQRTSFVLTAAHVIDNLRHVREVITRDGTDRKRVEFDDAAMVQEYREHGRRVGETKLDLKVLNYSEEEDLGLLQIWSRQFQSESIRFPATDDTAPVGTELLHCGSPGGQDLGANAVTPGIVAQVGRMIEGKTYDQVTTAAIGGSSGGVVADSRTGEYVGMLTMGISGTDSFAYIVPLRRIRQWANRIGAGWLLTDENPTQADIDAIPIEDGPAFGSMNPPKDQATEAKLRFLVTETMTVTVGRPEESE